MDSTQTDELLAREAIGDKQITKLLLLGNSGAGKSFLCNALLGAAVFRHAFQADSVTSTVSFGVHLSGEGEGKKALIVADVPGLIEADEDNIPRNEAAVTMALKYRPRAKTVIAFVFGCAGGRLTAEDLQAVRCVVDFATVDATCAGFIMNNVPPAELEDEENLWKRSVAKATQRIADLAPFHDRITCIPHVEKHLHANFQSPAMVQLRNELLRYVAAIEPRVVTIKEGAVLRLDKRRMLAQIAELKAMLENEKTVRAEEKKATDAKIADLQKQLDDSWCVLM